MNTKTLLAALVGAVVAFLCGFLIYGMLLETFMKENMNQCASLPMKEMNMVLMILANLVSGLVMALILSWAGVTTLMGGLTKGAIIGFMYSLCWGLMMLSMTTMYNNTTAFVVDVLVGMVMSGLIGGAVGWMLGRGKTAGA